MLSQEIAYNVFKYYPKNRIITNTFKTMIGENNANPNDSAEIMFTNVNNPWERREMTIQNEHFHSMTESNLLNLYDNVDRKGLLFIGGRFIGVLGRKQRVGTWVSQDQAKLFDDESGLFYARQQVFLIKLGKEC